MNAGRPHDRGGVELAPGVHAPAEAVRFAFTRGSGPGGQNVNKLNTRAELRIALADIQGLAPQAVDRLRVLAGRRLTADGELRIVAQTSRTQEANRQAALLRLRQLLLQAMRCPRPRRPTRPTRSSIQRRRLAKQRRSDVKRLRAQHLLDQ